MNKSAAKRNGRAAGFTLVEMLIAVALTGIVISALAEITANWIPNWSRGFARVQRSETLDVTLARLAGDLGSAEFITANRTITEPLFEGTESSVTFVRSALGPNTRPGLELVRIRQTADQPSMLVRARLPFTPTDPQAPKGLPANFTDPVPLLRGPYRLSFAYAGADGQWRDTWIGANELPRSIRVTVRDAADARNVLLSAVTTLRIDIPADCVNPKSKRDCAADTAAANARPRPQKAQQPSDGQP